MSLRDDVDRLLPGWESWYPSLFHAAEDLGLIRARVCSPGSLMISQRHAKIYSEALHAFRVQWSAEEAEGDAQVLPFKGKRESNRRPSASRSSPLHAREETTDFFSDDSLDHLRGEDSARAPDVDASDRPDSSNGQGDEDPAHE